MMKAQSTGTLKTECNQIKINTLYMNKSDTQQQTHKKNPRNCGQSISHAADKEKATGQALAKRRSNPVASQSARPQSPGQPRRTGTGGRRAPKDGQTGSPHSQPVPNDHAGSPPSWLVRSGKTVPCHSQPTRKGQACSPDNHVVQRGRPDKSASPEDRKPKSDEYDPWLGRHPIPVVEDPNLMEKITNDDNLLKALRVTLSEPKKASGIDRKTIKEVCLPLIKSAEARKELIQLIKTGRYTPSPVRIVLIPKGNGKMRTLGIAIVRDRVVQRMILQAIEASTPNDAWSKSSFAYTAHTGVAEAIAETDKIIAEGYQYAVCLDLKAFFDNVPHSRLKLKLQAHIKDKRARKLIEAFLTPVVVQKGKRSINRVGTPQGSVVSPWLASKLYLDELDRELESRGHPFVRYADDCTVFARSLPAAKRIMKRIVKFIEETLQCPVNTDKTVVVPVEKLSILGVYRKGGRWRIQREKEKAACRACLSRLSKYSGTGDKALRKQAVDCIRGFLNHYRRIPDIAAKQVPALERWLGRHLAYIDGKAMKPFDPTPFD